MRKNAAKTDMQGESVAVFTRVDHCGGDGKKLSDGHFYFDRAPRVIDKFIMPTATVADLRNNFRRVSAWIDDGQPVEITRHGKPFARLVPDSGPKKKKVVWPDFAAQRKEIWGDRFFSAKEVAEMEAYELEGQEG